MTASLGPVECRSLAVAVGLALLVIGRPVPAAAQGMAIERDGPIDAWVLTGVDMMMSDRWRSTIRLGHLGGFDTYVWLSDLYFVIRREVQLTGGVVYLEPRTPEGRGTWVMRGGGTWQPLRGRLAVDNRLLAEWRAGASTNRRVRDRLRASWAIREDARMRAFATVELFVMSDVGFSEHRYQVGATATLRRAMVEAYWLRSRPRVREGFDAIGLTAVWRVGRTWPPRAATASPDRP